MGQNREGVGVGRTLGTGGLGITKSASESSCVGRLMAMVGACGGGEGWRWARLWKGRRGEWEEYMRDARGSAFAIVHVFEIGYHLMVASTRSNALRRGCIEAASEKDSVYAGKYCIN